MSFDEKWIHRNKCGIIESKNYKGLLVLYIGAKNREKYMDRAVACVNAFAIEQPDGSYYSVADPQGVMDAIRELLDKYDKNSYDGIYVESLEYYVDKIKSQLSKGDD